MIDAIHFNKLNNIGYGNAYFPASFYELNDNCEDIELISSSGMTLTALCECGFICEENQSVESINLAERGTLTLGDYLFRINGLLESCVDDEYKLVSCISMRKMLRYVYEVLYAVSLEERLLCEFGCGILDIMNLDEESVKELYLKICMSSLSGLSGGQQQRLRLSSLFLIERVRYDIRFMRREFINFSSFSDSIIKDIEHHPMQLLVLDEPDHHFDDDFFVVLSRLLSTLDLNHQENLTIVTVLHKDLHEDKLMKSLKDESKEFIPKLRILKMKSIGCVDRRDVEMEMKYPLLKEAFQQYDVIERRNNYNNENNHENNNENKLNSKLTISVSIIEESNCF